MSRWLFTSTAVADHHNSEWKKGDDGRGSNSQILVQRQVGKANAAQGRKKCHSRCVASNEFTEETHEKDDDPCKEVTGQRDVPGEFLACALIGTVVFLHTAVVDGKYNTEDERN